MCERVRRQIGSAGVYRVRVSERVWVKAKSAAGIGLRGCWRGSELNGHPRGHEHEPRRERGVCREDARCFGREVLGGCRCRRRRVVVVALCPALSQSHTHARTQEKQTQRVTPVKKVDQNTPDMQVALPRCMNAMAVHCGAPITATRLSPFLPMDQLERAVFHTHITMIPLT